MGSVRYGGTQDWLVALSTSERSAIEAYSRPATFQKVQNAARAGRGYEDPKTGQDVIEVMDEALTRSVIAVDTKLYRSVVGSPEWVDGLTSGSVIDNGGGYVSTVTNAQYVGAFGAKPGSRDVAVTLRILADRGTHALPGELQVNEWILPRGTEFVVDTVERSTLSDGSQHVVAVVRVKP
jgi:hypothetical protein